MALEYLQQLFVVQLRDLYNKTLSNTELAMM